jgi:hypothetical protein
MKTNFAAFTIGLDEEGGAVLSGEGGEGVTFHNDVLSKLDADIIQRVVDAVKIAHVLNCVPFDMTEEVTAIYELSNYTDDAIRYYDYSSGCFAWKKGARLNDYRVDFICRATMLLDAADEIAKGDAAIFGPDAAVIAQGDGTYVVTQWDGETDVVSNVEDALAIAGFFNETEEV